jgi:hypothetical protein
VFAYPTCLSVWTTGMPRRRGAREGAGRLSRDVYVCNLPRRQHCATPCPRGETSKVIAPAEGGKCLPCLRGENVLVLFCGIKKGDCPLLQKSWGPGGGSSCNPVYIYTPFRISAFFSFLEVPASNTPVWGRKEHREHGQSSHGATCTDSPTWMSSKYTLSSLL